jgi:TrmH family RNA methyltransferase
MVSKNIIKHIQSLQLKKFRDQYQQLVIEGEKMVLESIQWKPSYIRKIFHTNEVVFNTSLPDTIEFIEVSEKELSQLSHQKSPNKMIALLDQWEMKSEQEFDFYIALDEIQDPGNMGTILRLADWFGVSQLICSKGTVDCFNPKVVQATMGSIARVNVYYENLNTFLPTLDLPIYGTFMDGKNVYKEILPKNAILVLGNEANGISTEIEKLTTNKIAIPKFGTVQKAESLNVAMATAIFLSEFKRSSIEK